MFCTNRKHEIAFVLICNTALGEQFQLYRECKSAVKLMEEIINVGYIVSYHIKVLFTNRCRRQNFRPSLLRLVDRLYTVIHKTQKTRTKVLPSATVGE